MVTFPSLLESSRWIISLGEPPPAFPFLPSPFSAFFAFTTLPTVGTSPTGAASLGLGKRDLSNLSRCLRGFITTFSSARSGSDLATFTAAISWLLVEITTISRVSHASPFSTRQNVLPPCS